MITDALCSGSSFVQHAGNNMQPHVKSFRDAIRVIIPPAFKWWVELDDDIGFSIRWIWMGNAAVSFIGRVEDVDPGILLALLSVVDWTEEIRRAIQSVEAYEAEALAIAQTNRRNALTGSSLPRVELPDPGPFSIDAKRQLARARYAQGVKYREFITEPARILFRPTEDELSNDAARIAEDMAKRHRQIAGWTISQCKPDVQFWDAKKIKLPPVSGSKSMMCSAEIDEMIATASRRKKPLYTRKEVIYGPHA